MKLVKYTFALFVLFSVIISCEKDDPEVTPDVQEDKHMDIIIDSPSNGTVFPQNETLIIQGQINSNFDAHGYIVRFWNISNNDSLLFETDGHEHGENILFNASWTNNLNDTSEVRIEVMASSDHQGTYTEEKNLTVTCLP